MGIDIREFIGLSRGRRTQQGRFDVNFSIAFVVGLALIVLVAALIWAAARVGAPSGPSNSSTAKAEKPSPATQSSKQIEIETIRIEPGTFKMGDPADTDITSDDYVHEVTLTKPYLIGKYPVTVAQFSRFVSDAGFRTSAERNGFAFVHADVAELFHAQPGLNWRTAFPDLADSVPVVCVSWYDARAFCKWMEGKTHKTTRLPTEAEWEYACRAGTDSKFNVDGLPDSFSWFGGSSGDHPFNDQALGERSFAAYKQRVIAEHCRPHPVGLKRPNPWGVYDMHGNVWEWCYDVVAPYPKQAVIDPSGPDDPSPKYRIARGGDWWDPPSIGTSFNRGWWSPNCAYHHIGFRIVQQL
jgi:formylglycine-generating enzyme required for sulfatase activity